MSLGSTLRAALRDEADGLQSMRRDLRPADAATLLNALLGLAAVLFATTGRTTEAAFLILLGVLADGLDGAIARMGHGGGPLGPTLDTLADVVTFGVAPAVLLVRSGPYDPVTATVAAAYLVAVLLRLARFEGMRTAPRGHFSGLSSPAGALVLAALVLVAVPPWVVLAGVVVSALLMTSRVRYPKLRGGLGATAVLVILAVLVTHYLPGYRSEALWLMLAFMAVYVLAGPFYVLAREGPTRAPTETP